MAGRKWLITGISSGFGQEIAKKVLADNDIVYGTARNMKKIEELRAAYSEGGSHRRTHLPDITIRCHLSTNIRRSIMRSMMPIMSSAASILKMKSL